MQARALTSEEIRQVRRHIASQAESQRHENRLMFELGINCGLRVSEITALNNASVWQNGPVQEIELYVTKSHRHERVPTNQTVRDAIDSLMRWKRHHNKDDAPQAPLFAGTRGISPGSRWTRKTAHERLKAIFTACELQGKVTTHSLRRTFASHLDDKNINLSTIQTLMRHRDPKTTMIYITMNPARLHRAVAALEGV